MTARRRAPPPLPLTPAESESTVALPEAIAMKEVDNYIERLVQRFQGEPVAVP